MSTKSVAQKLQIKPGMTVWSSHADRVELLGPLPEGTRIADRPTDAQAAVVFGDVRGRCEVMTSVRSQDGTAIAYDRVGSGPPLIVVGGAFSYRRWKGFVQLAELLSDRFTVVNYDRRGRGDSGDAGAYAVEREVEDLAALVDELGGQAAAFGMSSGGVLALRAAAAGVPLTKLVVYQPPFLVGGGGHHPPPDFGVRLRELIAGERRGAAVSYFMSQGMGAPAPFVALMRLARPLWSNLKAVAHTLPYDHGVMGETLSGKPLGESPWSAVTAPTLVVDGSKSPASLHAAADQLAARLADGERRTLAGQSHNVSMKALAPVIADFVAAPARTAA